MGTVWESKTKHRLTGPSEKILNMSGGVALQMRHPAIDPAHTLVSLNDLGLEDPSLSTPRIIRELGFQRDRVYDFVAKQSQPGEVPVLYRYNTHSKEMLHLADQVTEGNLATPSINLNNMAAGIFMSRSPIIEALTQQMGIAREEVFRRLEISPRLVQQYLSGTIFN